MNNAELNVVATEETKLAVQVEDTPSAPDIQGITEQQKETTNEYEGGQTGEVELIKNLIDTAPFPP